MKPKIKHLQMYMRMAEAAAQTSSSLRLKVGAVAVKNNRLIGSGYNALPAGMDGPMENKIYANEERFWLFDGSQFVDEDIIQWLDTIYPLQDNGGIYRLESRSEVRHAEKNLILNVSKSTESLEGSMIFCTHSCCRSCSLDLADLGITHFYYKHPYRCDKGLQYLVANGIIVEQID